MQLRPTRIPRPLLPWRLQRCFPARRPFLTLAIETSCDDTAVAVVERGTQDHRAVARLHFHKKITSDNSQFQGVHPLVSLQSHQENLALLVSEAISHLPPKPRLGRDDGQVQDPIDLQSRRLPDVISVTRGPGMRSSLFTGLDTAKGLATAWQIPLVGVHHMQAHALTPRLVSALEADSDPLDDEPLVNRQGDETLLSSPEYPFLSLLASGGHTLLIHSASLTDHRVLGGTNDIAIGEYLDKIARVLLPPELLSTTKSTMYGSLLETFAFGEAWQAEAKLQAKVDAQESSNASMLFTSSSPTPRPLSDNDPISATTYLDLHGRRYKWYEVASNNEDTIRRSATKWGWGFTQPLTKVSGGTKIRSFEMSFSGLMTAVERVVRYGVDPTTKRLNKTERSACDISLEERKDIARETMRIAFEHVCSRVILALQSLRELSTSDPAVVMAGGVAANSFLRHILASTLCAQGFSDVHLHFPPPSLCTDNAAMIGWTGLEMLEAGHTDPLSIRAIRKWPLDKLLDPPTEG